MVGVTDSIPMKGFLLLAMFAAQITWIIARCQMLPNMIRVTDSVPIKKFILPAMFVAQIAWIIARREIVP